LFGLRKKVNRKFVKQQQAEDIERWEKAYGAFDREDYKAYDVTNLPCESEIYHGTLIKWAQDLKLNKTLFVGDTKEVTKILKDKIDAKEAYCAGLSHFIEVDFNWDFEEDNTIPKAQFDGVFSQAMLEHLIDPYKHVKDLSDLLCKNGALFIHTQTPGFQYHRHPIDCLRFYPDWFETVAKKLNLTVKHKKVTQNHIFYCLIK
jgi:SAM-dependent methyltransferase